MLKENSSLELTNLYLYILYVYIYIYSFFCALFFILFSEIVSTNT